MASFSFISPARTSARIPVNIFATSPVIIPATTPAAASSTSHFPIPDTTPATTPATTLVPTPVLTPPITSAAAPAPLCYLTPLAKIETGKSGHQKLDFMEFYGIQIGVLEITFTHYYFAH